MSRTGTPEAFKKYIEQDIFSVLREYADAAEAEEKRHWAKAMREAYNRIDDMTRERDALQQRIRDYSDITSGCPDVLVARTALTAALAAERERCAVIADKWMLMELARVIREMT